MMGALLVCLGSWVCVGLIILLFVFDLVLFEFVIGWLMVIFGLYSLIVLFVSLFSIYLVVLLFKF